ncbi:MAG TPA: NAD(P)H-hydrate dehydratase [Nevskiales bacterium]|nr:NAD(P)H-hydrate dehydratase [Nevskiales bacterium]
MSLLPAELYRAAQVRELDRRAIEQQGIAGYTLMQRAAAAALRELRWRWPDARRVAVLCGSGNNGGDGLLLAAQAHAEGLEARVLLAAEPNALHGDAAQALEACHRAGVRIEAGEAQQLADAEVIVDALLGTGLTRPVEGRYRQLIEAINRRHAAGARVLAVDIPSGLDADRGCVLGAAVEADVTVSFIGLKLGLLTGAGPQHCGRLVFAGLEVPAAVYAGIEPAARRIGDDDRRAALPPRARDAHKGRFGHVLLVGGDTGMSGAIRLAGEACLRSGAGLVSIATRAAHAALIPQARPELMCHGIEQLSVLEPLLARASVVAIGPGLGQSEWGRAVWERLRNCVQPLVVDADALNLLAQKPGRREDWILTPHPGEAARLLGIDNAAVQADRPAAVQALAERYGGVAVLKGSGTLVQAPGGVLHVCDAGNPGMAVGGMGDLLCGVIAGLRAQGLDTATAARIGVFVHARAGDRAAAQGGERGLLPSDLLPSIRALANP